MKSKILFSVVWIGVFLTAAFISFIQFNSNIIYSHANFIADFSDDRKAIGASENVFVAKIIKDKWEYQNEQVWPQKTLFEAEVIYSIKWKQKKNIKITQIWWYDPLWNLHIPHGTEYFKEGDIYLLVSSWEEPYNVLSHENGSHLLATMDKIDQKMTDSSSNSRKKIEKEIIKESRVVKEFREAYKNEVYYEENEDWKYKISSEKNAYKNLWKKEKEDFENFESGFVE